MTCAYSIYDCVFIQIDASPVSFAEFSLASIFFIWSPFTRKTIKTLVQFPGPFNEQQITEYKLTSK